MQSRDLKPRQASVLLPLAGGLLVAAIARLPIPAFAIAVTVVTFVGLGVLVPEHPWGTAAIAEAPGLALALIRAADHSVALVGVVVLMSPLALAISAALVGTGARPPP